MLVLDRSGSMGVPADDPYLADLKRAAKLLVDQLDPARDRVGLVSYSTSATLDQPLTSDFDAVKRAIDDMVAEGQTNIGGAVFEAQAELDAHGRADAVPVMLVVSDGAANQRRQGPGCVTWPEIPNACTEDAVNQAVIAKSKGTTIFAIGLNLDWIGDNVWHGDQVEALARETLQAVASSPPEDYYFEAPDPADLDDIIDEIVAILNAIAST